jgi:hypothetical protein
MPVRSLPSNPNLNHLKYQAKDLLKGHAARNPAVAQRIRELAGHDKLVRLLVERGARVDLKDVLWQGTPAGWAKHAGKTEVEVYLRAQERGKDEQE